jgi:hypothetical protein
VDYDKPKAVRGSNRELRVIASAPIRTDTYFSVASEPQQSTTSTYVESVPHDFLIAAFASVWCAFCDRIKPDHRLQQVYY